jgi:hypothetical protein
MRWLSCAWDTLLQLDPLLPLSSSGRLGLYISCYKLTLMWKLPLCLNSNKLSRICFFFFFFNVIQHTYISLCWCSIINQSLDIYLFIRENYILGSQIITCFAISLTNCQYFNSSLQITKTFEKCSIWQNIFILLLPVSFFNKK